LHASPHFLLFADPALDSRVFAMAHERLALFQGALWGWGGTLGIPTIDYYIVPEVLWQGSKCPQMNLESESSKWVAPQDLFNEQVVMLTGLPPLPRYTPISYEALVSLMQDRYLLPIPSINLYLIPVSVKHIHPEFDAVIMLLLKTDPQAMIVLAVPWTGRDMLPPTHIAARHDVMHPTMPAAAVAKLRNRLRATCGTDMASRLRVLPPLEVGAFAALQLAAVAVLDPFPVGMNTQVIEALLDDVPVVSAPSLQECTNSHTLGLKKEISSQKKKIGASTAMSVPLASTSGISSDNEEVDEDSQNWPTTPEEYAFHALSLITKRRNRRPPPPQQQDSEESPKIEFGQHGKQLLQFFNRLLKSSI